jgi:hypothetical protein
MNLYLTFDDKSKIKKCFLNLRKYLVISSDEVVENLGFDKDNVDNCSSFIISQEIKRNIKDGSNVRKLLAIIYSNSDMNDETIRQLIYYATEVANIEKVIPLTERGENEDYYELFEEIMFYPTLKKVHIVECKAYPVEWLESNESMEELDSVEKT